jgi:hypothetical protein
MATTRYLDFVGGNDGNDGSSFANRKKTLASACSGLTGGDTVRVMASPAATSLGQNATWTQASETVTLTSAVTANISDCESVWTSNANSPSDVTVTASTSRFREGTKSADFVIAAAFTTGLVAYFATGTLDLSAYQQISFWFRSSGTHASGVFTLKLCSDTLGAIAVNTVNVPAVSGSYWTQVTVDTAGALGSAIASVALYAASDPGSVTVNIDNIIACKASSADDSLTLTSLISLNTDANEPWFGIRSINGTTIKLACGDPLTATSATNTCLYLGNSGSPSAITATTYKREPITLTAVATTSSPSGTNSDTLLAIEGGYDRTNMSTQSDITWIRQQDPSINGIVLSSISYNSINKIYVAGCAVGFSIGTNSNGHVINEIGTAQCQNGVTVTSVSYADITDYRYSTGCNIALQLAGSMARIKVRAGKLWGQGNSAGSTPYGIYCTASTMGLRTDFYVDEIKNWRVGYYPSSGAMEGHFYNTTFASNSFDHLAPSNAQSVFFFNCIASLIANARQYFTKYNQTANDHRVIWDDNATPSSSIATATDQRNTASDYSWKFTPKSTGTVNSHWPMQLSVAKIACPANEQRTVTLYARRDSTSLSIRLRCPGGQIAGVASDVTDTTSGLANAWEQLSISFTPTEAGVVEVFAEVWGGSTLSGWVDDLAIT